MTARAVLTVGLWVGVPMLVSWLISSRVVMSPAQIITLLASNVLLGPLMGLAVLALAALAFRFRTQGFRRPIPGTTLRVIWFPLLTLTPFVLIALGLGLPPGRALLFLALNTALIALSEEWAFRGILLPALLQRMRVWPAVLGSSAAFGAMHVLNAFTYGALGMAVAQAVAATMTGVLLAALRLRTGSLWVPVAYHMAWNFAVLLVGWHAVQAPQSEGPLPLASYIVPIALVTPNLLCALVLLRRSQIGNLGPTKPGA